ncbi:PepSY domain-containing protein [Plastorhodobacter daqingensis]|uniref:PepSY domain-containing protein n=1 Tax=Plastorhodobacter daqingensis TaxID=1387281 RepID=A0ABW2UJC7_9RHOB
MKRTLATVTILALLAGPALADSHGADAPDAETIERINAMLAGMNCEIDPEDIELEDDGTYDLDDVMCADGQYDMKLDADLNVTERRKE